MTGTTRGRLKLLGIGLLALVSLGVWLVSARRRPVDPHRDYPEEIRAIEAKVAEIERYKAAHGSYPPAESVTVPCASCFYALTDDGFEMGFGMTLDRAYIYHGPSGHWTMTQ